jgi:hypothetical protein
MQTIAFPRHDLSGFGISSSLSGNRGRRESRAPAAPAASRAKNREHTSIVTTGSARHHRLSPRNGLTVSFVLSPVKRRLLPPSPAGHLPCKLDATVAAPGPHDFCRTRPAISSGERIHLTPAASIASPALRSVTIAKRPSGGHGTRWKIILIFIIVKSRLRHLRRLIAPTAGLTCYNICHNVLT